MNLWHVIITGKYFFLIYLCFISLGFISSIYIVTVISIPFMEFWFLAELHF